MTEPPGEPTTRHDCVFCAIAAHQAEASIVHEDETVVVFMALLPATPGHLHVIPATRATGGP